MAFFRLVIFASKFNRIYKKLKKEKEAASAISRGEKPKYGLRSKIDHLRINCKKKVISCLTGLYFLRNTALDRCLYRLRKYGSFENYILKSIFGFLAGYLLTYMLFLFLSLQLNVGLKIATLICCVIGCILTIGLAFSEKVRCIVFLTLPQFFSKRGRQALIAYALILTMTGPTRNILNNMGIMSESLACGQEQLKSAVRQILDVIKKPFVAIKEAIKAVVKAVKEIVKKIKDILIKIKRIIMAILNVIKAVFQFLGKILSICNKELGTPYERCNRVFETAVTDCQAKLGSFFGWACSIGYLLSTVCYIVKPFDLICMLVDFISNSIIGVVVRKVKIFIRHVKTMFYVRIKFSHSFHFQSNSSKSMKDVAKGIVDEVKTRTRGIAVILQFFSTAASLFFIFLIFRVIHYRYKFLTKERFDNRFLTKNLAALDLRRASLEKETILPLLRRERKKYITVTSLRLIAAERKQLSEGLNLLISTALKIGIHMAIDYSLFWIMMLIRKYGKFQSKVQTPNIPTIHIAGQGLLADLLKGIVKSFQPLGISLEIDTVPCLPTPIPPDTDRYIQIGSILLLCLILTIFEPYGLRWRHSILCYYYPKRAKERAVWLYNHILRSRSSFLKFARRQLRRKVLGTKKIAKVTCIEYLRSKTNNKFLLIFLGSDKQRACLFCGEIFRKSDKEDPIECQRPGCTAIYCRQCFEDLENICTVCLAPIEYGDKSDISEEKDSSDEDYSINSAVSTENDDSGRSSQNEGSSTDDYSYGYQESEKVASNIADFETRTSVDLEKQHIPDYASTQGFDDVIQFYDEKKHEETQSSEGNTLASVDPLPAKLHEKCSCYTSSSRKSRVHHETLTKSTQLSNNCPCLSFHDLDDLAAELLLEAKSITRPLNERSEYTNTVNSSSHRFKEKSEELLMEFSSDEESNCSDDNNTFYSENAYKSKSLIEADLKSDNLLSDSELSDIECIVLMGKSKRKPEELTFDEKEDPNCEIYSSISHRSENTMNCREVSNMLPYSEVTEKISSLDPTKIHLVTQSDSSITELKRPTSISSRNDSYRHIEFVGLDESNNTNSLDITSGNDTSQKQPESKIYRSTIATKTSSQNIPSHMKERKSILKMDSESSIISEMGSLREKVFIPKLNLAFLDSGTSDSLSETPPKGKKKFDVEYQNISEISNQNYTAVAGEVRKFEANERLKGGAHLLNTDSEITPIKEKKLLHVTSTYLKLTAPESFETPQYLDSEFDRITSSTHSFRSGYTCPSLDRSLLVGSCSTSKIDGRFFESSDSSIPLACIDKVFLIPSRYSVSPTTYKYTDTDSTRKHYSFSMTTENISGSLETNKTNPSTKFHGSNSEQKTVRITNTSGDTEGTNEEDQGEESDASSDISISVQENILGTPKKKEKEKIDKKQSKKEIKNSNSKTQINIEPHRRLSANDRKTVEEVDVIDKPSSSAIVQKQNSTNASLTPKNMNEDTTGEYRAFINSGEYSINSRKSKSISAQKYIPVEEDPENPQFEDEKQCNCCVCRNKISSVQHSSVRDPNHRAHIQSSTDSYTQTNPDFTNRCCPIQCSRDETDIVTCRCFNKSCSVRCKPKNRSGLDHRFHVNEHCLCDICTRLLMDQEGQSYNERETHHKNPIKPNRRNVMLLEYPSSSNQKYESSRKTVGTVCKPLMRDQASYVKQVPQNNFSDYEVSFPQEGSDELLYPDCGCYRDIFDLPYQDNDEYTRLVRELEEKLVARNRERVRRTIRQFEECSSQNQNLRKPIVYDESSCGEEPILSKLVHLKAGDSNMRSCGEANKTSPILCRKAQMRNMKTVETMARYLDSNHSEHLQRYPRYRDATDPSKWQLDNRTGEWCKVSGDCYEFYDSEQTRHPPESDILPRRRILGRCDEGFRCDDCEELNRRYGHRFHILCCPRHRSDIVPKHRKI